MDLENLTQEELKAALEARPELKDAVAHLFETTQDDPEPEPTPEPEVKTEGVSESVVKDLTSKIDALTKQNAIAECGRQLDIKLGDSGLSEELKSKIRARFDGKLYEASDLEDAITFAKDLSETAKVTPPDSVPWGPTTESDTDRYAIAMDGLIAGAPQKDKDGNIVAPFLNLRHAYAEMTGKNVFSQTGYDVMEALQGYDSGIHNTAVGNFGEATTAMVVSDFRTGDGLGKILGDSITRRALQEYKFAPVNSWRRIAKTVAVSDLRKQLREQVGEFTLVEDVTENPSAYPDLSASPLPVQEAFYQLKKRGGTAALTLEAIINDDLNALRNIPTKLGRSAATRIYRTVWELFKLNPTESLFYTGGSGSVTLFDTTANRAPGNLVNNVASTNTTPIGLNDATLTDAKYRFRLQQAATTGISGKISQSLLAAEPKILITAAYNEAVAIKLLRGDTMFATDMANAASTYGPSVNIHQGTLEHIVVPYWDGESAVVSGGNTLSPKYMWFVTTTPDECPMIEVGFLNGRDDPEIFVQNSENVGSMWDKDVIQWKLRHFWDANFVEHRGVVGATVT